MTEGSLTERPLWFRVSALMVFLHRIKLVYSLPGVPWIIRALCEFSLEIIITNMMDGVKVALGNRGMTVEAARQCAKDRKEWRALVHNVIEWVSRCHFCFSVFFWTALPCSGGYHMERGGMLLHDVVGINCKMGATTENQVSSVEYMG